MLRARPETKVGVSGRQEPSAEACRGLGPPWAWAGLGLALAGRRATCPKPERRLAVTQVVADIYCNACDTRLGWKYVEAFEESQKYKEGKYIIEKAKMVKEGDWS